MIGLRGGLVPLVTSVFVMLARSVMPVEESLKDCLGAVSNALKRRFGLEGGCGTYAGKYVADVEAGAGAGAVAAAVAGASPAGVDSVPLPFFLLRFFEPPSELTDLFLSFLRGLATSEEDSDSCLPRWMAVSKAMPADRR